MIYKDPVYGKIKISEPVVLEIIKSQDFQRLKGVDQTGYLPLYFKLHSLSSRRKLQPFEKLTRFEHSLGVFILLKKFNAPFGEQIAGLIHDVSHTAFSHAIDYVVSDGSGKTHCYQDKIFNGFIKKSEIPSIFKKYDLDLDYILNKDNFPLLEKELPDLCADRIDYSFRNAIHFKVLKKREVDYFLNNLLAENNLWLFKDYKSARKYAELFLRLNTIHYAGFPTAVMFQTVADLLKYALEKKYLKKEDLFTTDREVISKIKQKLQSDKNLRMFFNRLNGTAKFENNPRNYDINVFCKSRMVDPFCKYNSAIRRVSEIDKNFGKIIKKELKPKEYFLKFKND